MVNESLKLIGLRGIARSIGRAIKKWHETKDWESRLLNAYEKKYGEMTHWERRELLLVAKELFGSTRTQYRVEYVLSQAALQMYL